MRRGGVLLDKQRGGGGAGTRGKKEDSSSAVNVAMQLHWDEGRCAFLTPKMLRASVNHAITFWVYDSLCQHFRVKGGKKIRSSPHAPSCPQARPHDPVRNMHHARR
jgi:hypothetical protein